MIDLIDSWTLLIVGCAALVLAAVLTAVFLAARRKEARRRQLVAISDVTRDWRIPGRSTPSPTRG
jgi:hypothetical protein